VTEPVNLHPATSGRGGTASGTRSAVAAVLVASVLFGTTGTAQELGSDATTPLGVGGVRLWVGGAVLVFAVSVGRRRVWSTVRSSPVALAAGAAGVVVYQLGFFLGTDRSGVAAGTLVALGSGPIAAAAIQAFRVGRWPARPWWVASTIAVTGIVLLVGGSGFAFDAVGFAGSLSAGIAYAVYATAAGQMIREGGDPVGVMAAMFAAGAVLVAPITVTQPLGWLGTAGGLVLALHLGVVTIALAYSLYGWGLARLPVATVVSLTLAEPMTAAILGWGVLDQRIGVAGWLGVGLVAFALVLLGRWATSAAPPRPQRSTA
jgi:DME family drug/metabolite transporter